MVDLMARAICKAEESVSAALWDAEFEVLSAPLREAHGRGVELQVAVHGGFELGVPGAYDLTLCGVSAQERLGGRRLTVLVVDKKEASGHQTKTSSSCHLSRSGGTAGQRSAGAWM